MTQVRPPKGWEFRYLDDDTNLYESKLDAKAGCAEHLDTIYFDYGDLFLVEKPSQKKNWITAICQDGAIGYINTDELPDQDNKGETLRKKLVSTALKLIQDAKFKAKPNRRSLQAFKRIINN